MPELRKWNIIPEHTGLQGPRIASSQNISTGISVWKFKFSKAMCRIFLNGKLIVCQC